MAARQIIVAGAMPARDGNGRSLASLFRFYQPDTAFTTPATVYTTSALSVAHPFPIESDDTGRWPQIWADEADYFDGIWTDLATDSPIAQYSDIRPLDDALSASVALAEAAAERAEDALALTAAIAADLSGEPFTAHSITSMSLTTGLHSLTLVEPERLYREGQPVVVSRQATVSEPLAPLNHGTGTVISLVGQLLTFYLANVQIPDGAGPYTDWTISLSSEGGVVSVAGETGAVTAVALKAALAIASTDIVNFAPAVLSLAIPVAVAL